MRFLTSGALAVATALPLRSLLRAFEELEYEPNQVVVVTGIGCWGKADNYLLTSALHVTHGRALAYATGVKAANPDLHVVALMGDGDGATIGGNHLIHSARRNMDLTAVIVNNFNYGMTGGQQSAMTPAGRITSTTATATRSAPSIFARWRRRRAPTTWPAKPSTTAWR